MKCEKPVQVILFEGEDKLDANQEEQFPNDDWGATAMELVMTGKAEVELDDGTKFELVQGLDRSPLFMAESKEEAEKFVSICSPGIEWPRFVMLPLLDEEDELDEDAVIEAYVHACAAYGDEGLNEKHMHKTVEKILAMRPAVMLIPINASSTELSEDEYALAYTVSSNIGRAMAYNGTSLRAREGRA
jgi:hypothetical protein